MKLKIDSIYLLFIVAAIGYFSIARSANPPNGRTGAPGDGLCLDCHFGGATLDGDVSINGLPAVIMPSTSYRITVTTTNPNGMAQRAGFQLVALDAGNLNVGTLSNPSASSDLEEAGGRTYFEHRPAVDFPASNEVSWEVDWLSPTTPGGETITFYTASIIGNGAGSGGDRTVLNTAQGTLDGTAPDPPVAMVTTTDSGCNGDNNGTASVTVTDGTPPFSFLWSNGEITQTISNLAPDSYSVTVTDGANLADSDMGTVEEPPVINASINITNVRCNGESNGSIDLEISGGNNSFSYAWSNGDITEDLEDIPAGIYSVTVSDAPSCVRIFTDIVVEEPDVLTAVVDVIDVNCNGNNNGEIAVTPSGGTAPYLYDWSDGASGPINNNLIPGTFSVTVTDVNMCMYIESDLVVAEPDVLVANVTSTNETSSGAADGTATANPVGGNIPYFYLWSNGENTQTITDLIAGPYTVTVTDNKNCLSTETVVVQAGNCDILAQVNSVAASCTNSMDGNAIVILTGGDEPFRYIWSSGDTTQMVDDLGPGGYQVTVTDVNNCIAIASGTVVVIDTQSPIANGQSATVYLDANGTAFVSTDQINNGSVDNCGNENLNLVLDQSTFGCNNLGMNTVILTVTDLSGNSDTASVTVTVLDTIAPVLSCQGTVLATECDAVSYNIPLISDNCTVTEQPTLVSGIPSGDIFPVGETEIVFTVSDASGNPTTCSFIVRVNPGIMITVDSINGSSQSSDGGIFVTVTGGSGSFSYEWMDSDNVISTDEDLVNVGQGFYELKVIDDSTSCIVFSDSIEVSGSVGTIDRALDNAVNIYPNPSTDFIQIKVNGIDANLNVEVMSLSGNVIIQQALLSNNESISVDHLSTGLYFVKIFDGERFTVRKILVN